MTVLKEPTKKIIGLVRKAETCMPKDVERALKEAYAKETNRLARMQLEQILKNARFARRKSLPICQDTGILTFYVSVGENSKIMYPDSMIRKSIEKAVKAATENIPLRKNSVDALTRKPLSGNVPKIHFTRTGKRFTEITLLVKGAGSENVTKFSVLSPTAGERGIVDFLTESVRTAGGKPCPPTILGVGIGGSADDAMSMSRAALLEPIGGGRTKKLERMILKEVNKLGIGPMGLGGKTTCLGVKIKTAPAHTASLPVAVSFGCWATRRATIRL